MNEYSAYVALIVATKTEEDAIRNMYSWETVTFSGDAQTYYTALIEKDGNRCEIVYAECGLYLSWEGSVQRTTVRAN